MLAEFVAMTYAIDYQEGGYRKPWSVFRYLGIGTKSERVWLCDFATWSEAFDWIVTR
jgi:hypothetical protein